VTTWGESHGVSIGAVIDGCPPGLSLTAQDIQAELDRRNQRQADDQPPHDSRDEARDRRSARGDRDAEAQRQRHQKHDHRGREVVSKVGPR